MKCSFGISDFLEEISSVSHSVVSLYFFALIAEEGFLISSCYSLELCIQMFISFLFSFVFRFSGRQLGGATPRPPGGLHARRAAAKRSYPTSEVRGSGPECQAAMEQEWLREAAPRPRSGAEARRTPCPKGGGQEELPHVRGQGQQPRVPGCDSAGTAERSYPASKVGGAGPEEIPSV